MPMSRFNILMYHRVASAQCPVDDPEERRYAVSLGDFERQLGRIAELGYRGVSVADVRAARETGTSDTAPWVVVTFDDGNSSDFHHALPLLRDRGFRATFFVTGNRIDAPGGLSRDQIREMHEAGMDIGTHGQTHRFFNTLSRAEQEQELLAPAAALKAITGIQPTHFAPPGGRFNHDTEQLLAGCGYLSMCTSEYGSNNENSSMFRLRRLAVMETTPPHKFDALVVGGAGLFPGRLRASLLNGLKRLLGERLYKVVRRAGVGN